MCVCRASSNARLLLLLRAVLCCAGQAHVAAHGIAVPADAAPAPGDTVGADPAHLETCTCGAEPTNHCQHWGLLLLLSVGRNVISLLKPLPTCTKPFKGVGMHLLCVPACLLNRRCCCCCGWVLRVQSTAAAVLELIAHEEAHWYLGGAGSKSPFAYHLAWIAALIKHRAW